MNKKLKIALISPSENAYSETFIQQHRNNLNGKVVFYFNGELPLKNEYGMLCSSKMKSYLYILKKKFKITKLTPKEQALFYSFKKEKIDLVIAEYGTTAIVVLRVCKLLNIPLIPIFHGYDASVKGILNKNKNKYKELFIYSKRIIAVSNSIFKTLKNLGCDSSKIIITPCAPEDTFFNIAPMFLGQQFFAVGRFVDKKAPYYLILAFKKVLLDFPKAKLVIAGTGPLFFMCKNLISYLNIGDNVDLLGIVTPEVIKSYLKESNAFVQHSVTAEDGDSEGTPVAILEASAAGLPVISTFHSGISDVIINKKTGLLVEEHDVDGMVKNMKYILNFPLEAEKMGGFGKENINYNFSKEIHIKKINQAIKDSL